MNEQSNNDTHGAANNTDNQQSALSNANNGGLHPDAVDQHPHKGVYLLPNLFTTGAMFSGFYAILAAMDGKYEAAAVAIFVAMIFDFLDGLIARLTHTTSDFGVQYDSLSDMVSFGIAPAVVVFSWMLHSLGRIGWAAAFVYASCAALRLARFNSQVSTADKRYFTGLASPAAAAILAGMVWSLDEFSLGSQFAPVAALMTAFAGVLMVSNVRYRSLKGIDMKGKVPFMVIFAMAMVWVVVIIDPPRVLFFVSFGYALSGLVLWLVRWFRHKKV